MIRKERARTKRDQRDQRKERRERGLRKSFWKARFSPTWLKILISYSCSWFNTFSLFFIRPPVYDCDGGGGAVGVDRKCGWERFKRPGARLGQDGEEVQSLGPVVYSRDYPVGNYSRDWVRD